LAGRAAACSSSRSCRRCRIRRLIKEPERALASGIPAIRALGNEGMFSPTLVPEEILLDHPERIRGRHRRGLEPILSYSDASRWREAASTSTSWSSSIPR
jgi:hypothetical protein